MNEYVCYAILFVVALVTAISVREALNRVFPMRCKNIVECIYSWELAVRAFISALVAVFVMLGVAYLLQALGLV